MWICEICSHDFRTIDELNAHQQFSCKELIEIETNIADCKPTPIDSEYCGEFQQSTSPSRILQAEEEIIINKQMEIGVIQDAVATTSKASHPKHSCETCNRAFKRRFDLKRHYKTHTSK